MSSVIRCKYSPNSSEIPKLSSPDTVGDGKSSPRGTGDTVSPAENTTKHGEKPVKKFSLSSAFPYCSPSSPRRQARKDKHICSPSLITSHGIGIGNRIIQPTSTGPVQSTGEEANDRKLSAPLDYRDSGVYLGERRRDPILEMLNLRKHQRAMSPNSVLNSRTCSSDDRDEAISPFSSVSTPPPDPWPSPDPRSGSGPECVEYDTESQEETVDDPGLGRHSEGESSIELDYSASKVHKTQSDSKGDKKQDSLSQWTEGLTAKAASLFINASSPFLFRKQRTNYETGNKRKITMANLINDKDNDHWTGQRRQPSLFCRRSKSLTGRDTRTRRRKPTMREGKLGQKERRRTSSTGDEGMNGVTAVRKISQPAMVRFRVDNESANCEDTTTSTVKKKRSFAEPIAKKLNFLRRRPTDSSLTSPTMSNEQFIMDSISPTSPIKPPSKEEIRKWAVSFDDLLGHKYGAMLFRLFLQREFSEENIDFWMACEEYKRLRDHSQLPVTAKQIYSDYVAVQAPKEVNLDSVTRSITEAGCDSPMRNTFEQAQHRIQSLMEKDSYPRFLRSELYLDLVKKY